MAKASQVVLMENEFYLIKAPNGKVLEVKNFNTENGAAIRLWDYAGHPWQQCGCPLPYNGVCDQRECLPEIATSLRSSQ